MFVLSKKRMSFVLLTICLSVFSVMMVKSNSNEKIKETVTLPVSGKTVILDAGHGTPDEGAESSNGITEAQINLKIAFQISFIIWMLVLKTFKSKEL